MVMQYWSKDPKQPDWTPDPGSPCRVTQSGRVMHDNFIYGGQIGGYWFGLVDGGPANFDQDIYRLAPMKPQREYEIDEMLAACTYPTLATAKINCEALHDAGYHNGPRMVDVIDDEIDEMLNDYLERNDRGDVSHAFKWGCLQTRDKMKGES